jgi:Bacterial aa3 type cytochrome c oxidase subunit IV
MPAERREGGRGGPAWAALPFARRTPHGQTKARSGGQWPQRHLLPRKASDTKAAAQQQSERRPMAVDTSGGHPAMDYPEHLRTYSGFLKATVAVIVGVALLLLFMLFYLVP